MRMLALIALLISLSFIATAQAQEQSALLNMAESLVVPGLGWHNLGEDAYAAGFYVGETIAFVDAIANKRADSWKIFALFKFVDVMGVRFHTENYNASLHLAMAKTPQVRLTVEF
jgi:hypothetical protein